MMKFAANLSMLYTEVDVMDRFKKAADAGFTHVEMLFPFHYDLDAIERELKALGLTMILFDTDAGDFAGGWCQPGHCPRHLRRKPQEGRAALRGCRHHPDV
jgi:hydroxypyruvate isomerase